MNKTNRLSHGAPRRRWRRWAAALLLVLLIAGVVWAVRPDPHLSRVVELRKELADKGLAPEERKAKFAELRSEMKQLTDDQKWDLAAPIRAKQKADMERYFAMSPKEKIKYLDERIDREQTMRKAFEKKGGKGNGAAPGGGFGGPGRSGGKGGNANGGAGPGGPTAGKRSSDEIENRRKQFLDRSSPEDRAQRDRFRKEMNDRRRQRGFTVR